MTYIDLAIAIGVFLFFIALVMGLSVQYFVKAPTEADIEEYREIAMRLFEDFFSTTGFPENWEESDELPSELGLSGGLYKVSVVVEELGTDARSNETVIVNIIFDEECTNKVWNDTIRVYDKDLNAVDYELAYPVYCSGQYLNESYIRFNVNTTQGDKNYFLVFYSEDTEIPGPNVTMEYCTDSWISCSGDAWSESVTGWSRYGGNDASVAADNTEIFHGSYSIQIEDEFDHEKLGLKYEPASPITGVSNNWYIDSWIYINDTTDLSTVNVSLSDGSDTIVSSIDIDSMNSGEWYHIERELTSSEWDSWGTFDASKGIQSIEIYMVNSTSGAIKKMKVDELHFELEPLAVTGFPEETEHILSMKKISALNNLTYEELRDVLGEDYNFRIEIIEAG
jgi:hypothetical protein